MSDEGTGSHVQVAPDSTGKLVHTLELTLMQADGSLQTVEVQAVAITNKKGRAINLDGTPELLAEILDVLKDIKLHMEMNA